MKQFAILCSLVAAFLCFAQNANAQYAQKRAQIVDKNGLALSDREIVNLVGSDVYQQTVIGARKQYKTGKKLINVGIIGLSAGMAGVVAANLLADELDDELLATIWMGSGAAMAVGGTTMAIGIPLRIIGNKRLDWVCKECNKASGNVTLNFGNTRNGAGIFLSF